MAVTTPRAEASELLEKPIESPWRIIGRRFARHRMAMISAAILGFMIIISILAPWITPYDPNRLNLSLQNLPPSAANWMGTDSVGRDILSRIMDAGRVSLGLAVSVMVLTSILGTIIGVTSGFFGGWVDSLLMRFVDFMLTLPQLPILLVLVSIFSPSIPLLIGVLVLFGWTGTARLVRGQVLSLREQQFVEASRALGANRGRIMFRHLVPNTVAPIIVAFTLGISDVIITEAVLSFLGFGVQPPDASWGNMLQGAGSLVTLERQPWQAFFPGLMIFIASLTVNFLGDGLRDALDPRQKL